MTKEAKKRRIWQGTVKRLAGGTIIMDFIEDPIDNGAPEFVVTGTASMERISAGQVRFTKYVRRRDGNYVTHHEVWDLQTWLKFWDGYERFRDIVLRLPAGDGPEGGGRRKEAH